MSQPDDHSERAAESQEDSAQWRAALDDVPFNEPQRALQRWAALAHNDVEQAAVDALGPAFAAALHDAARPDQSLLNIERFLDAVPDRTSTLTWLVETPRAIEILVRLFVGSPTLTELLVREPERLQWLTDHRGLAEFPSREQFVDWARQAFAEQAENSADPEQEIDAIRRFQRGELLRIAACDTFHLVDLKTATRQLSLLADAMVWVVLEYHAARLGISPDCLTVIAFGKLGGLELNYSSDIDLVFLGQSGSPEERTLAQHTIRSLSHAGRDGFLYRVDMRLRPWGQSGPLVTTPSSYMDYLKNSAELWEKQAILKARVIAGNFQAGEQVLREAEPIIYGTPAAKVRANVLAMKDKIERSLTRQGRSEGHVKSGEGGIRDIEFVTQFLQLTFGKNAPSVRTSNTTEALLRLFDVGALEADQYRSLSAGYMFHRVVEHALQLQDMGAVHELPTDARALDHLARRLDFPSRVVFVKHYRGHCRSVRAVFDQVVGDASRPHFMAAPDPMTEMTRDNSYHDAFSDSERMRHRELRRQLASKPAVLIAQQVDEAIDTPEFDVLILGRDMPGELSIIAGLFQAYGFDIASADAFSEESLFSDDSSPSEPTKWFADRLLVRDVDAGPIDESTWSALEAELNRRFRQQQENPVDAYAGVALRVADAVRAHGAGALSEVLLPIEVTVDNEIDPDATVMQIRTEDAPGVLFNLTTALALARLDARRVLVRTEETPEGRSAVDTFYVVDEFDQKLSRETILELRAAVVLTTQFTNLLPHSPDPRRALVQFRQFLENLFSQPGWLSDLASLQDSGVLLALTRLLGTSEFLWDDFLRYQHANLFPIVSDIERLQTRPSRDELAIQLEGLLAETTNEADLIAALNQFKDRQMLRVDLRQILNVEAAFNNFGRELTDVAEVVVSAACRHYAKQFDVPLSAFAVCALGKCGGIELGYASDIELIFVYDSDVSSKAHGFADRVEKLVSHVRKAIKTARGGVFEVDLRLRPHGKAGPLAVSLESFEQYFGSEGPAWPFERQALVKLRPIEIDPIGADFAQRVVDARDNAIYTEELVDGGALLAMRERQLRQLVEADTFNAKLSQGGLVDIEYSVQVLQRRFGSRFPELRVTNTRDALKALEQVGLFTSEERIALRDAYRFLRRVINGLRMVRGDAQDLTVPPAGSEERAFLVRRLEPHVEASTFDADLESHIVTVLDLVRTLPDRLATSIESLQQSSDASLGR